MRCDECTSGQWWHAARRDDKADILRRKLAAHETDDILDRLHGFGGNCLRALRAVGQDRVDIDRILYEFLHFGANRPEFRDREINKRGFEGRKLAAAELAKYIGFAHALQRRVDADQVVGFRTRRKAFLLARQRFRISLGLADFLRDGIRVVGQVDAGVIGCLRL